MKRKKARRRFWTPEELATLIREFSDTPTRELAQRMGRTRAAVSMQAQKMGLRKSDAYLADSLRKARAVAGRGTPTRFKPGHTPWNKGVTGYDPGGRSAETRFKPGRHPSESANYRPIGSLRINVGSGHLERKVTDDQRLQTPRRWVGVHRLVWEEAYGPIPDGYVVAFKDGRTTTVLEEITLDRLELVSRVEMMQRNTRHNLPPELSRLMQLRGALNRKIKNRSKAA